jgi:malate/lactate dehydrogenase
MPRKKYLTKRDRLTTIDVDYRSVEEVAKELQTILEDFGAKGYYNITIDQEKEYGYYDDVDIIHVIYGTRRETDNERDKRLEANRKAREAKKAEKEKKVEEDRKLFESLKKTYGW